MTTVPRLTRDEQHQILFDLLRKQAYREWKNHETLYDLQVALFRYGQEKVAESPFIDNDFPMTRVVEIVETTSSWTWKRFGVAR